MNKQQSGTFLGAVLLCLLGILSCADQPMLEKNQGSIRIQLVPGSGSRSRAVLGPEHSALIANGYEVFAYSQDGQGTWSVAASSTLGPEGSAILPLEAGEYQISVLAGVRRSSTAKTTLLLGSATAPAPVTVTPGQRTSVSLTLLAIDLTVSVPESARWGDLISVQAQGATRNPGVGMSLSGPSAYDGPRIKSTALWDGYQNFSQPEGTPDSWSAQMEIFLPNTLTEADIQFFGAAVILLPQGSLGPALPLPDTANYTWKWPNRLDMADDCPLVPLVYRVLPVTPPDTGLELLVQWE